MTLEQKLTRNIRLLWWGELFRGMLVIVPIVSLWYHSRGLGVSTLFYGESVFALTSALMLPAAGWIADKWQRNYSFALGCFFVALAATYQLVIHTFWDAMFAQVIWGMGAAFSGCKSALLFDSLRQLGRTDEHQKLSGHIQAAHSWGNVVSAVAAGLLFVVHPDLPLWLTIAAMVVGTFLSLWLAEAEPEGRHEDVSHGSVAALFRRDPALSALLLLGATVPTVTLLVFWMRQPLMETMTIPAEAFGLVMAAGSLLAGVMAHYNSHLERLVGGRMPLLALFSFFPPLVLAVSVMIHLPWVSVALLVMGSILGFPAKVVLNDALQPHIPSAVRATMGNVVTALGTGIKCVSLWALADLFDGGHGSFGVGLLLAVAASLVNGGFLAWVVATGGHKKPVVVPEMETAAA